MDIDWHHVGPPALLVLVDAGSVYLRSPYKGVDGTVGRRIDRVEGSAIIDLVVSFGDRTHTEVIASLRLSRQQGQLHRIEEIGSRNLAAIAMPNEISFCRIKARPVGCRVDLQDIETRRG